jgi:hypothetical protein
MMMMNIASLAPVPCAGLFTGLPVVVVAFLLVLQPLIYMLPFPFTTWQCERLKRTLLCFSIMFVLTPEPLSRFHTTLPVVVVMVFWFYGPSFLVTFTDRGPFYSLANHVSKEHCHGLGKLLFKFEHN